jgi:hypothetical protein
MFTKNAFVVLGIVIVFCSCNNRQSKEDFVVRMLGDELENSNKIITHNTDELRKAFEENLANPMSNEKALFWQPKVIQIEKESKLICENITKQNLSNNIKWEILAKELQTSKAKIRSIDVELTKEFENNINRINEPLDSLEKHGNLNFLNSISKNAQKAILLNMITRIKVLENDFIKYCFYRSQVIRCGIFNMFGVLVNQSTTHIRVGEQLEISAGVGAYSSAAKPNVAIANKKLDIIDSRATYRTKVSGSVGKHKIPVVVDFLDENGNKQTKIEYVEYTIDP